MKLGERIRSIRKEKGITQIFLAKSIGYSTSSHVCAIEKGKAKIDAEKIPNIAEALGVSIDEIFFGEKVLITRIVDKSLAENKGVNEID